MMSATQQMGVFQQPVRGLRCWLRNISSVEIFCGTVRFSDGRDGCVVFVAFFSVIIPAIENSSLDRKREMIRELTNSAWNILAKLEHDEKQGLLTRSQAQSQAIDQIQNLHYGQQMKDYFWINDMHPRMVIRP